VIWAMRYPSWNGLRNGGKVSLVQTVRSLGRR
jgi:hypothetical protein